MVARGDVQARAAALDRHEQHRARGVGGDARERGLAVLGRDVAVICVEVSSRMLLL